MSVLTDKNEGAYGRGGKGRRASLVTPDLSYAWGGVSYIVVFFTAMELTLTLTHTKYFSRSKCPPNMTSLGWKKKTHRHTQ